MVAVEDVAAAVAAVVVEVLEEVIRSEAAVARKAAADIKEVAAVHVGAVIERVTHRNVAEATKTEVALHHAVDIQAAINAGVAHAAERATQMLPGQQAVQEKARVKVPMARQLAAKAHNAIAELHPAAATGNQMSPHLPIQALPVAARPTAVRQAGAETALATVPGP